MRPAENSFGTAKMFPVSKIFEVVLKFKKNDYSINPVFCLNFRL